MITGTNWQRFGRIGESGLCRVRAVVGEDGVGRLQYVEIPHTPADAKLIAAAPDMAQELERLLDVVCDEDQISIKCVLRKGGWLP